MIPDAAQVIGYVIVDAETRAIDWDCDIHPTQESAIESMTGPRHMYCKDMDGESDEKTWWGRHYIICLVMKQS